MEPKPKQSPSRPNLYLVGFMGTGKSVIGRKLSELLNYSFIDSDDWIEQREGQPIPEIFQTRGEAYFRSCERDFIESGHPAEATVVSCGGGLIIPEGMVEQVKEKGRLFCLFASPETILKRTQNNPNRPLLQGEDPEARIRTLMAEREPIYLKAGTLITTDQRPIPEIVNHIKRLYEQQTRP